MANDSGTVESKEAPEELIEPLKCRGYAGEGRRQGLEPLRQRLRRSTRLIPRNLGEPLNNRVIYAASRISQLRKSSSAASQFRKPKRINDLQRGPIELSNFHGVSR